MRVTQVREILSVVKDSNQFLIGDLEGRIMSLKVWIRENLKTEEIYIQISIEKVLKVTQGYRTIKDQLILSLSISNLIKNLEMLALKISLTNFFIKLIKNQYMSVNFFQDKV